MADYIQADVWMAQVRAFLVTRNGYQMVMVKEAKDEIWLLNPNHPVYPVVRITKRSVDEDYFLKDRNNQIHNAVLGIFKLNGKRLELHCVNEPLASQTDRNDIANVYPLCNLPDFVNSCYPGLDGVVHNEERIAEAIVKLDKELEIFRIEEYRRQRKKRADMAKENRKFPVVSAIVMGICVAVFIVECLLSKSLEIDIPTIVLTGGYYKAFLVGLNEWWRFLTAGFVHGSIFHLISNMMALFYTGRIVEKVYGKLDFFYILIGSVLVGNLFVFVGDGNIVACGLSGGLYGVMGATFVLYAQSGLLQQKSVRSQIWSIVFINMMISMMPDVSWLAHLGGLIAGVFLSMILSKEEKMKPWRKHCLIALLALCAALGYLIPQRMKLDEIYAGTDMQVQSLARKAGMGWYAEHVNHIYTYYEK
ncbi:MAG: rhomboid family intramembrane serine protease [Erysipelotrichaceae bacterium]|nr:rhomboid family intramembrane serine protease [Erysipelotrichaceae bacterium]